MCNHDALLRNTRLNMHFVGFCKDMEGTYIIFTFAELMLRGHGVVLVRLYLKCRLTPSQQC